MFKIKMLIILGGAVYLIDQKTDLFDDIKDRLNLGNNSDMDAFMFADGGGVVGGGGFEDFISSGGSKNLIESLGGGIFKAPIASLKATLNDVKESAVLPVTFTQAVKSAVGMSTKDLLDVIAKGEGTSDQAARLNGYASGYDVPLGYGKFNSDKRRLTSLTLDELYDYQKAMLPNKLNSTACGRYQIVNRTMFGRNGRNGGLVRNMGLSGSAIFSPKLQDDMAIELLNGRGYKRFLAGKMSVYAFQSELSIEWASIAHPSTGRSAHGQATGTSTASIQQVLNKLV